MTATPAWARLSLDAVKVCHLANRSLRWAHGFRWRNASYRSDASPIIIGGCDRSGTTLMRVILDSHSQICCGPETQLFALRADERVDQVTLDALSQYYDIRVDELLTLLGTCRCRTEFIEKFLSQYAAAQGKPIWAEKTPRNIEVIPYIFKHFPRALFVHMIRDGRDVACSLRTHPRHTMVDGQLVKLNTWKPLGPCVRLWKRKVSQGLSHRANPRYVEVRYEDLVLKPEETTRRLCAFLQVPWEESLLAFHRQKNVSRAVTKLADSPEVTLPLYNSAIGRWRRDLNPRERSYVNRQAGVLLRRLGYDLEA